LSSCVRQLTRMSDNTTKMSTSSSKTPRSRLSLCLRVLVTISAAVGILANAITILRIKDENYTVWFQPDPQFPNWGRPRIIVHLNSPDYLTIWTWIIVRHSGGHGASVLTSESLQSRSHGTLSTLHATAVGKGQFILAYQLSWTVLPSALSSPY
jgi:hypothetical protein